MSWFISSTFPYPSLLSNKRRGSLPKRGTKP